VVKVYNEDWEFEVNLDAEDVISSLIWHLPNELDYIQTPKGVKIFAVEDVPPRLAEALITKVMMDFEWDMYEAGYLIGEPYIYKHPLAQPYRFTILEDIIYQYYGEYEE